MTNYICDACRNEVNSHNLIFYIGDPPHKLQEGKTFYNIDINRVANSVGFDLEYSTILHPDNEYRVSIMLIEIMKNFIKGEFKRLYKVEDISVTIDTYSTFTKALSTINYYMALIVSIERRLFPAAYKTYSSHSFTQKLLYLKDNYEDYIPYMLLVADMPLLADYVHELEITKKRFDNYTISDLANIYSYEPIPRLIPDDKSCIELLKCSKICINCYKEWIKTLR